MATFDNHANLAASTVATAPSPATSGTSLSVQSGDGANFPAAPFNCTVWPAGSDSTLANAEIIRVTSKGTGDNWTIVRAQEGTTARTILTGDQIGNTVSKKVITDLETAVNAALTNVNFSAGTTSNNLSAVTFTNSNGVSFGLNGSVISATVKTDYQSSGPYITTAMQSNAATISNVNFSAGTTSNNLSAFTFSNSNGVSFGLNASTLTASIATTYAGTGFTTTTVGGAVIAATHDTNGLKLAVPSFLTTADLSANSSKYAATGFTTTTAAGAVVAGTNDTNGLKLGVPAFITTAMLSNAATISNVNISAGSTSANASAFTFSNANNVTFGLNAGVITASVVPPSGAAINISAGTTSTNAGAFTFSNSNNFSFGIGTGASAGVVTGSYTVPTITSWTVSDAATSATVGRLAFTNSNGLTLSLSTSNNGNHTVIGSYTVPTVTNSSWTLSDAATSVTVGRLAFTNSNGLTLSLSTSNNGNHTLIGSYTVPNVPAATSWTVSDANTSATVGRLAFTNANGLTLSLSTSNNGNHTVIGSYTVPTVTNSSWTVSDSATSATVGRLAFVNSNGVSFGLSTSNNGQQTITATVQTNYLTTAALSSQTLAFSLSGNTATTNSSQISNGAFALAGGNNVTLQQSNNTISISVGNYITTADLSQNSSKYAGINGAITGGSITVNTNGVSVNLPAYLTTAAQSTQTLAFTLGGNVATTNSSQAANGGFILAGGNNVTIQQSNNSISISAGNAAPSPVNFSAGTTSNNLGSVVFSNANGVSFGLNGSTITASAAGGAGGVAISNSQTLFSTGTVAFSEGGGAITIASSAGGQSLMFSVPQTSSIVGVNGISLSTNGSTISVSNLQMASYWANLPTLVNSTTTMCQSNSFYVLPLVLPFNISVSYLRFLASMAFTSTSIGTSAVNNVTGASTAFSETVQWNAVLYTALTGASSRSLGYYYSNSAGATWAASVSQASTSNASNQSISQSYIYPSEGANTATFSTQYSVSTSNGPISTTHFTAFTANRFLDIPFATSLSAGNYWLAFNRISGTVGGKNLDNNATIYGNSQQNLSFGNFGAATNVSNCPPQLGLGLWTTNAAQTTSSIAFANISATTSYGIPLVQLIRQA